MGKRIDIDSWQLEILKIDGVKDVMVLEQGLVQVLIAVKYSFWTHLLPGLNARVDRKVRDFVCYHRPFRPEVRIIPW